jgi:hypothetical protein
MKADSGQGERGAKKDTKRSAHLNVFSATQNETSETTPGAKTLCKNPSSVAIWHVPDI